MKKRKFLWGLAAFSILLTVGSIVLSCTSDTTIPELDDPEDPGTADSEDPGTANTDPEDPVVDPVVTKSLEVVSQPSKTVYKIYEYADYTGLIVEKVENTDGVETSREQVDLEDLSMSVAQGEQLTEVNDSLAIRITLLDDAEGEYGSTYIYLKVEDLDQVTVTFKNYDGTTLEQDTIYVGQTTTYDGDTPSRAEEGTYSYRFLGWYVEDDESQTLIDLESYTFDEDTVLYALFQEVDSTYYDGTLTYAYDGGFSGYIVTAYDSTGDTDVVVPDSYNSVPVVGIAEEVFQGQSGITSIKLGANVKSVGASAFASMTNSSLTIELNEGLETLGNQAFASNTGITSLVIPGTVKEIPYRCFYVSSTSGSKLTDLTLSEGITTICEQAFYNLAATDLTLPNSITTLESNAFNYYYKLTNLTIGAGLTGDQIVSSGLFTTNSTSYLLASITVDSSSEYLKCDDGYTLLSKDGTILYGVAKKSGDGSSTYTMPSSVVEVADSAFYYFRYSTWTAIQIGENVRVLGDECFSNANGVDVLFNEKVEEIGYRSFYFVWGSNYSGNKELVLPDSVTTIREQAFASNSKLISVKFGANMQNFGINMFNSSSNITTYSISEDNTYLYVDGNIVLSADKTTIKYYLNNSTGDTSYTMLDTVTRVEDGAFYGQTYLSSITFSSNLEYIGRYAFYNNTALACNIAFTSSLTYIGEYAFYGSTKITGVEYPGTVIDLGSYAFYNLSSAEFTGNLVVPEDAYMGESVFRGCSKLTSFELNVELNAYTFYGATALESVQLNKAQTTIPEYAFYNCSSLSNLVVQDGITTIDQYAFYGTSSLEDFTIPAGIETLETRAFYGSGIKEAVLPETLRGLGTYAFYNATNLESIEFKGSLEELPAYVFQNTSSLETFVWPNDLTTIGNYAFSGSGLSSLTVPSGVTTIGSSSTSYVFANMTNLESASLPNTVTYLGGYVFASDTKLTSVNLPDELTELPAGTFYKCSSINWSSLPDTITTIGNYSLQETSATEFTLGANVTSLGTYVFYGASQLKTFNWNATEVTSIPNYTFYNATSFDTFNLGEGVNITTIGDYAFYGTAFDKAPFDMTNVTSIGARAFYNCTSLEEFELPTNTSFTSISNYTFYGCSSLEEITLPENVSSLGTCAFQGDSSLTKVTINNPNLTISATSASNAPFRSCTNISEIYFNGTEEEARAVIEKSTSSGTNVFFGTSGPTSVTVYCNDDVTWTYTAS